MASAKYRYIVRAHTETAHWRGFIFDEIGTFDRKADALKAAQDALLGFRVTCARVAREQWGEYFDMQDFETRERWQYDREVKEFKRPLQRAELFEDWERFSAAALAQTAGAA